LTGRALQDRHDGRPGSSGGGRSYSLIHVPCYSLRVPRPPRYRGGSRHIYLHLHRLWRLPLLLLLLLLLLEGGPKEATLHR
jgi:hypothetical protein